MESKENQLEILPGVRACQFVGKGHIKKHMPCQDAYAFGTSCDGWLVLALADGVSNSPHSETAARIAADAAVESLVTFHTAFPEESAWYSALRTAMNYALRKIDELAGEHQESFGFETTLAIILLNPGKEMFYIYTGDGGVYLRSENDIILLTEKRMRTDDGSVFTLSSGPEYWNYGRKDISDIQAVLMVTDGVSDVIREGEDHYALAQCFMQPVESNTEYQSACEKVLQEKRFEVMDDDASFVLYCQRINKIEGIRTVEKEEDTSPQIIAPPASKVFPWDDNESERKQNHFDGILSKTVDFIQQFFCKPKK